MRLVDPRGGVLVDALHYNRSAATLDQIAALPARRVNHVQFCGGPDPFDPSDMGLIRVARGERLLPGHGGIDLIGLVRAIPPGVTVSVGVPNRPLAAKVDTLGRAAMAHAAATAILRPADWPDRSATGSASPGDQGLRSGMACSPPLRSDAAPKAESRHEHALHLVQQRQALHVPCSFLQAGYARWTVTT